VIFKPLPNEAAGCISYLIGCERAGVAAVVDAAHSDVDDYVALAGSRGLAITHVVDTHIHADHVSGNRELAARTGASLSLHEAADARFPHGGLRDGERLRLGTVELRVLHTPGHAPESMCLVVTDTARGAEPWFVLTGCSSETSAVPTSAGRRRPPSSTRACSSGCSPSATRWRSIPPTAPARAAGGR
jgi:hydroxyacylglutathione hydrolase